MCLMELGKLAEKDLKRCLSSQSLRLPTPRETGTPGTISVVVAAVAAVVTTHDT